MENWKQKSTKRPAQKSGAGARALQARLLFAIQRSRADGRRGPRLASGGIEAGADSNVGVVAGNSKREPHAACRRNGETEGRASGFHAEGKAGIERDGEVRWAAENSGVRSVIQFERQALPFLIPVLFRACLDAQGACPKLPLLHHREENRNQNQDVDC